MTAFLHYVPHSDFEAGIFVPFGSLGEAQMQASSDLVNGMDPDFIDGIFEAKPHDVPKFGWTRKNLEAGDLTPGYWMKENRRTLLTKSQIVRQAPKIGKVIEQQQLDAQADYILAVNKAVRDGSDFKMAVPGNAYAVMTGGTATGGAVALTAATAKTVCMITAASANQPALVEAGVSFDGVTASAVPVLCELVSGTATTTGTVTSQTPKQLRGWPAQTAQTTGQINATVEPTVQLVNRKWLVTPNGGLFVIQFPLGREPTGLVTATTDAKTWSLRLTAPAGVNCHAYLEFEE